MAQGYLSSVDSGSPGQESGLTHHPVLAGQALSPPSLQALQLALQSQHLTCK